MTRRDMAKAKAVALVALGLVSVAQSIYFFKTFVDYEPPFPEMPEDRALGNGPRIAKSLLVVVVDGLRLDVSNHMDALNLLRERGTDFTSLAGLPSLSLPGDAVLFTGSWQEFSGVTTNWYRRSGPDSVFDEAKSSNLKTATAGYGSVDMMFGRSIDIRTGYAQDPEILGQCLGLITNGSFDLMAVHFSGLDHAGHLYGGRSDRYMKAAADIDAYIAEILKHFNFNDSVVIVTSDHGHRDEGGHGGGERDVVETPLIIAGRGVRHVSLDRVNQSDVAPTMSVILGIPIPSLCQGRPLVQALDVDAAVLNKLLELNAEQKSNLYARYRIFLDLDRKILGPADSSSLSNLMREVRDARIERLALERGRRLPWLVAICILPLVYLCHRGMKLAIPLVGVSLYLSLDGLIYMAGKDMLTLSIFNSESVASALLFNMILEIVVTLLTVSITVGLLGYAGREDGNRAEDRMADTTIMIFEAMLIQIAYIVYVNPIGVSWALPNIEAWYDLILRSIRVAIVGLISPIYMLVARLFYEERGRITSFVWHRPSPSR